MTKLFKFALVLMLLPAFLLGGVGCTTKNQIAGDSPKPIVQSSEESAELPDSYPNDVLPLAADAIIIDVRENPANNGLEIMYVSGNDADTLCDYYEGALKDANDLNTDETEDGYLITATMDSIYYTIMLSKDAMDSNPLYAGKISVYIILSGLDGISEDFKMPEGQGEEWPSAEMPGVPQLAGHIGKIIRDGGIISLEITVENADVVTKYIDDLRDADFSFDTDPETDSAHIEFLAFKDGSIISFAYKGEENLVFFEFQK